MAENIEGREYDWNDEIENDGSVFEPLPEGEYDFTIEKFERGRSKGEGKLPPCNMAIVYFTVHGPDWDVSIKENYILHTRMEWKLSELFRAIGAKKKGERVTMNWNLLPGAKGRCLVKLEPGFNDPSKKFNRIDKLLEKEVKKFEPGKF